MLAPTKDGEKVEVSLNFKANDIVKNGLFVSINFLKDSFKKLTKIRMFITVS